MEIVKFYYAMRYLILLFYFFQGSGAIAQEVLTKVNGGVSWVDPSPLLCRDSRGYAQSISSGSYTDVKYTFESFDIGANFNLPAGELTIPEEGYYLITASIGWNRGNASNQTSNGTRSIRLIKNGTNVICENSDYGSGVMLSQLSVIVYSDGNDKFKVQAWQNSSHSHNIGGTSSSDPNTTFSALKVY